MLLLKNRKNPVKVLRGFTLIELLIVIAIIGILASIVLVTLSGAKERAREAKIKSQAQEFKKLLQLEFANTGSYTNLTRGWIGGGSTNGETSCELRGYAGAYASQAVAVCNAIRSTLGTGYSQAFSTSGATTFSIMARYPNGSMYCIGSSGRTSDNVPYSAAGLLYPGCVSNP